LHTHGGAVQFSTLYQWYSGSSWCIDIICETNME